jgi:hypothetical protein
VSNLIEMNFSSKPAVVISLGNNRTNQAGKASEPKKDLLIES